MGRAAVEGAGGRGGDRRPGPRSGAEWTTLAVSAVVVAALVGAALYEEFARAEPGGTRLRVTVAVDSAEEREGAYYVPWTVENDGDEPAEAVTLVFTVKRGEETVEESSVDVPFLPTSGSAEGELVTAFDPATHTIEARVGTLQVP